MRSRFGWMIVLAALLGAWELYVRVRGIPDYLLPAPTDIAATLWDERSTLADQALVTLREMVIGLAAAVAAGLGSAIILHRSDTLRRAVYPLLVASQSVPVVAVAPILVIYLGFGLAPKVLIVALVCFFPVTVATLDALRAVDPEYRRVMRTLNASPRRIFWHVEMPFALPGAFSGTRVAASYSAVAALFAEYAGGSGGLAESMRNGLDTPLVGAAITLLALMSMGLFALVTLAERLALPWSRHRR
jgi:ABC-type nitrate/sulfonate/bicarbonate transport system permease component